MVRKRGGVQKSMGNKVSWTRKTQEGCGGLRGENPGAFPKAGPIFQQPFSLQENAKTLAETAFRAAGKSVKNFPTVSKFAGNFSSKEFRTATAFSSFLNGSLGC